MQNKIIKDQEKRKRGFIQEERDGRKMTMKLFAVSFFAVAVNVQTMYSIVDQSASHTTQEALLRKTQLNKIINAAISSTLFAPTDSAFSIFEAENGIDLAQLVDENRFCLRNLLRSHLVETQLLNLVQDLPTDAANERDSREAHSVECFVRDFSNRAEFLCVPIE